jgi:hypothetical protein
MLVTHGLLVKAHDFRADTILTCSDCTQVFLVYLKVPLFSHRLEVKWNRSGRWRHSTFRIYEMRFIDCEWYQFSNYCGGRNSANDYLLHWWKR